MADKRYSEDGPLIKVIKDSGAIIIVRGNISQVRYIVIILSLRVHYLCILKIEFGVFLKILMINPDLVVAALEEMLVLSLPDVSLLLLVQILEEAYASQPILTV